MKNRIIVIAGMLMLLSVPLQAQNVKFGVKGGLNISSLSVDPGMDYSNPNSRLGIHLGGFAMLDLAEGIIIQPEATFSTQGVNYEDEDEYQRVKLNYFNLAGMLKYKFDNFNVFAGPQIGLLMGGEFEEEEKADGSKDIIDAGNVYKGTDFSLGFGAGYTLDSGIEISARYNFGLTDNNDDPDEDFFAPSQKVRSRVLQLTVSYIF